MGDQVVSRYRTPSMGSPTSPVTPYHNSPDSVEDVEELASPVIEDQTSAEHAIDLYKIESGEDVRTTVRVSFFSSPLDQFLTFYLFYRS